LSRIRWCEVDDAVLDRFISHDCRCPIRRKRGALAVRSGPANRRRGAQHFLHFLQKNGAVQPRTPIPQQVENPLLSEYRVWLERHRGAAAKTAAAKTIERYIGEASRWLPALGPDPAAFDAATIRKVVLDQDPQRARASVRMTITVLRSYLRFLVGRGKCRPALVHAIPPAPQRRLAPLVRYVSPDDIERIIAACDTNTPIGVRDRAIILLLARLGLRAGDVWRMRLSDIDWSNARLRLYGKEHRASSMPLPQDVGDAVMAYLEQIRPTSREERVFPVLCSIHHHTSVRGRAFSHYLCSPDFCWRRCECWPRMLLALCARSELNYLERCGRSSSNWPSIAPIWRILMRPCGCSIQISNLVISGRGGRITATHGFDRENACG